MSHETMRLDREMHQLRQQVEKLSPLLLRFEAFVKRVAELEQEVASLKKPRVHWEDCAVNHTLGAECDMGPECGEVDP